MCQVAQYLREQTEQCRLMAMTTDSAEWGQVSLVLQREQTAHAERCHLCEGVEHDSRLVA